METRQKILVVDDDNALLILLSIMLSRLGYEVASADGGKTGLSIFLKNEFDMVFSDYEMPGMKGDELASVIKARDTKQPVVLITAYAELLQSSGNPLTGVDWLISKPFLLENLRQAIAKVTSAAAKGPA